jgi:hypothetical protein
MKTSALIALLALGLVSRAAAVDAPPTDVVIIDHAKVETTGNSVGTASRAASRARSRRATSS